ncbi:hypothetical protein KL930_005335 [Ogataea haglerorum]|nr:hypothetical protein KL947_002207 [Ogataea haglerorum]KAG7772441.1 hypothetical protein KL930_005335 [Ogataea haglerorum]KAG7773532.1 hypothetical protein KL922_005271 [Ogataea haglerorum]
MAKREQEYTDNAHYQIISMVAEQIGINDWLGSGQANGTKDESINDPITPGTVRRSVVQIPTSSMRLKQERSGYFHRTQPTKLARKQRHSCPEQKMKGSVVAGNTCLLEQNAYC